MTLWPRLLPTSDDDLLSIARSQRVIVRRPRLSVHKTANGSWPLSDDSTNTRTMLAIRCGDGAEEGVGD